MARPATGTSLPNPVLSTYFKEYMDTAATRLAGLQALPVVNVPRRIGDITILTRESMLKTPDDLQREARGPYNRTDWTFQRTEYRTEEYGIELPLEDSELSEYQEYIPDMEEQHVKNGIDYLLRAQEIRIYTELFNATTFSGYTSGITNEWDDSTNATPKADITTLAQTVRGNCGLHPTHLLMPVTVFENVMNSDEIRNYLQYTAPHAVLPVEGQRQILSQYLGVEVILAGAYYDSADEGQAASLSAIWGTEYALLFVKSSAIGQPGIGWTLNWATDSPQNVNVETYEEDQTRSTIYRMRHHTQSNVFAAEFGYLISNMTT